MRKWIASVGAVVALTAKLYSPSSHEVQENQIEEGVSDKSTQVETSLEADRASPFSPIPNEQVDAIQESDFSVGLSIRDALFDAIAENLKAERLQRQAEKRQKEQEKRWEQEDLASNIEDKLAADVGLDALGYCSDDIDKCLDDRGDLQVRIPIANDENRAEIITVAAGLEPSQSAGEQTSFLYDCLSNVFLYAQGDVFVEATEKVTKFVLQPQQGVTLSFFSDSKDASKIEDQVGSDLFQLTGEFSWAHHNPLREDNRTDVLITGMLMPDSKASIEFWVLEGLTRDRTLNDLSDDQIAQIQQGYYDFKGTYEAVSNDLLSCYANNGYHNIKYDLNDEYVNGIDFTLRP